MKKTLPLLAYVPVESLFDGDWKARMSERAREIAEFISIEMADKLL